MGVNIFYLSPNPYGGWVTFTAHLAHGLHEAGFEPAVFKRRDRCEYTDRPFGYDVWYRNLGNEEWPDELVDGPIILAAVHKKFAGYAVEIMERFPKRTSVVIHDPTELDGKLVECIKAHKINHFVIRKANLQHLPTAKLLLHPYQRMSPPPVRPPVHNAVSISRIDFDKNTAMLLDANRLLPEDRKISIRGFENRIYTRFNIVPHYPEWVQSKAAYPREIDSAVKLCAEAQYMVDMSLIKGDGGGTQYTFLEAMDAQAVPVIHYDWIRPDDEMRPGVNCLAVRSAEELRDVLMEDPPDLSEGMNETLSRHDATTVARTLMEML